MKTLLTPNEVVRYAGLDDTFPRCDLRLIFNVELMEARKNIGLELYSELLDDKADYSGVVVWNNGTAYNEGQIVRHMGVVYVSLTDNNTDQPNSTNWDYAPKFHDLCNNQLWDNFMAEYLSWIVVRDRIGFVHYRATGNGIQVVRQRDHEAANAEQFSQSTQRIDRKIAELWSNMRAFLVGDVGDCEFNFKDECDKKESRRRNQYRFG